MCRYLGNNRETQFKPFALRKEQQQQQMFTGWRIDDRVRWTWKRVSDRERERERERERVWLWLWLVPKVGREKFFFCSTTMLPNVFCFCCSAVACLQCDQNGQFIRLWATFIKPLATINLSKSPTFLGNFCKGVKIYHFIVKSFLGNFYRYLAIFFWSHC